ncbi:hypothetical protein [Nocardia macrotermitis]|uniref:hypothetical protein n=1 Tax=Nocardia macrotermitis TaxID=2585198 RepID=UPI0012961FFB|nr:hypothetical protein [Nocardia macrotermitis]
MPDRGPQPTPARILHVVLRAARSGYRLTRDSPTPYLWQLSDALDHSLIHAAETLDEIERWLDR